MARSTRTSLVGQAAAKARKVVGRRSPATAGANGGKATTGTATASSTKKAPAAKKTSATKSAETKSAANKSVATKSAAKKTGAKKTPASKAPVKKAASKQVPAAKSSATKASTSKAPAKKAASKQAAATKTTAKKASTSKAPAKKAASKQAAATKTTAKKAPAKKAAKKATAKKATAKNTSRSRSSRVTAAEAPVSQLVVKEDEQAWTHDELQEVLVELTEQRDHSAVIVAQQEADLSGLMRDSGDGAGQDQADLGATSFERDHELTVLTNEREKLAQIDRALARIEDGSYGVCESCGNPVGKMRLMAFPRATLCMTCKQREERR